MSTLTLPNGTVLTRVTRASCLARMAAIPLGSFEYSQTRIEASTDRRADCSGLMCYLLATPTSGPGIYLHAYNTGSFTTQQVLRRIDWADLLPGDMVGYCAPDSPGNGGHIAAWQGGDRRPDGRLHVWDHGSGWGPKDRWVQWSGNPDSWLAPKRPDGSPGLAPWRYVAIIEGEDPFMALTEADQQALIWRVHALVNNLPAVVAGPTKGEVNQLHEQLATIRALLEATGPATGIDTAAVLAGVQAQLDAARAQLAVEIRDAVADLGEGGAAQVRADA